MFKLLKMAPMIWMAYRWYKGQKTGAGAYRASRAPERNTWR